jgi:hypothetical protein
MRALASRERASTCAAACAAWRRRVPMAARRHPLWDGTNRTGMARVELALARLRQAEMAVDVLELGLEMVEIGFGEFQGAVDAAHEIAEFFAGLADAGGRDARVDHQDVDRLDGLAHFLHAPVDGDGQAGQPVEGAAHAAARICKCGHLRGDVAQALGRGLQLLAFELDHQLAEQRSKAAEHLDRALQPLADLQEFLFRELRRELDRAGEGRDLVLQGGGGLAHGGRL